MTSLLSTWDEFPAELEFVIALLLGAIVITTTAAMRIARRGTLAPLERGRLAVLVDAPRWLGVLALLVAVFGFFLSFQPDLARAAVDAETGRGSWPISHERSSRLLALGAGISAIGFLVTWSLGAWCGSRRGK